MSLLFYIGLIPYSFVQDCGKCFTITYPFVSLISMLNMYLDNSIQIVYNISLYCSLMFGYDEQTTVKLLAMKMKLFNY